MKDKNAWNNYSPEELKALENLNKGYIDFISEGKTERECTELLVKMAEAHGYRDLNEVIKNNETLSIGSKVYAVNSFLHQRPINSPGSGPDAAYRSQADRW